MAGYIKGLHDQWAADYRKAVENAPRVKSEEWGGVEGGTVGSWDGQRPLAYYLRSSGITCTDAEGEALLAASEDDKKRIFAKLSTLATEPRNLAIVKAILFKEVRNK